MTITWPLKRPPFRAQYEALQKGWDRPGFNFYMEQGLGKSATTLANFELLRRAKKVRKLLVIAPNSFKGGWAKEIEEEGLTTPVFVWTAGKGADLLTFLAENREWIVIVNYEAVARLVESHGERLAGPDTMVAADESIKLKNPRSQMSRAVLWLGSNSGFQRNLSGKPVTQGSHDLWAQLKFIKFIKKMNYFAFRNTFCEMGGWQGKQVMGAKNTPELNRILAETSFLARKKDFTDLPSKLPPITVQVEMQGDQLATYKQMERLFIADLMDSLGDKRKVTVDQIITRDIKLRQIMSGWMYDEEGKPQDLIPFEENHRFKVLDEIISEQVSGKSVVVSWYKPTLDRLLAAFHARGYEPTFIRGGMTVREIDEEKRKFNESDSTKVMVVQQVAAKYGHTLLGTRDQPCSSMQFFEQSYSLDDRSQIEDRIHRYGQVWPCSYFDFTAGKLDRAVIRALQRKEAVAGAILGYIKGEENLGLQAHALNDALAMAFGRSED